MTGSSVSPAERSRDLRRRLGRAPPDTALIAEALDEARSSVARGEGWDAVELLETLLRRAGPSQQVHELLGVAHRQSQSLVAADKSFGQAMRLALPTPELKLAAAQTRYELGQPASAMFLEAARHLASTDPDQALAAIRNAAQALASEGDMAAAETLLHRQLSVRPDWLDGHRVLASLRWVTGAAAEFDDSYRAALAAEPGHRDLWLAWFGAVAQVRQWSRARQILAEAQQACGDGPDLAAARLFSAVEGGEQPETVGKLLQDTERLQGDVVNLCRTRWLLRQGDAAAAEAVALSQTRGPSAMTFWPYVSLAWRLSGDPRAQWLDGEGHGAAGAYVRSLEVDVSRRELAELADLLRQLHTLQRAYPEQSVRGGVQTDRSILLRGEPQLQRLRRKLLEAVRQYVDGLPPHDGGHPLLGLRRDRLLLEGSWSVQLTAQGYNVAHTHPRGWISSAFYVSLPPPEQMGPSPAGWIVLGEPPPELNLPLGAQCEIAPQPGRLVLFPSYAWHCTRPFAGGERLVVAFDIRRRI
jgi:tetratricopeptide (TPR) repeat protein